MLTCFNAVTPHDEFLRYAHRAKSIQNSVKCNEDVNEKVIRELKEEIEKLRQQLLTGGGGGEREGGVGGDGEEVAGLQVQCLKHDGLRRLDCLKCSINIDDTA